MSDLKKKLEEIQKLANKLPEKVAFTPKGKMQNPPGSGAASPAPTGGGGGGGTKGGRFTHNVQPGQKAPVQYSGGGGGINAVGAIKKMQQSMQEFAAKVTAYSATTEKGKGPPDAKGKPTDKVTINDSRKDFNDFLTEQYLATSDVKGAEWSKDPNQTSLTDKKKQETDLIEMDYVVDGLKRIGNPKSELAADNVWDFRTNNALKNIYAFAYALLNVEKDFGKGAGKVFNANDLKSMHENIPMDLKDPSRSLSAQDKITRSEELTRLIDKLGNFYEHYVKKIALNPYYRTYIEKQSPMYTVKAQDADPGTLSPEEQKRFSESGDKITIPNVVAPAKSGQKTINLPLSYLRDDKTFSTLMTQVLGYSAEEATYPAYKKAVLDAILNHVQNYLSQAPPAHL